MNNLERAVRKCILLGVLLIAGCDEPARMSPTSSAPITTTDDSTQLDFSHWPTATAGRYLVGFAEASLCDVNIAGVFTQQSSPDNPHRHTHIVVRVNPEALEDFKAMRPLAVGSVVVKEKHRTKDGAEPPMGYTAMVKREPGYDPDHGDWEYVEVKLVPVRKSAFGKLQSCIACHDGKKNDDYLFRDYMK